MNAGGRRPSRGHRNRRPHNWSIYDAGDGKLMQHGDLVRGDVFDLGCGEQPYREFFSARFSRYIGVDWGESPHELTADVVTDLNLPLPFPDGCADTILSLSVIEHLSEPQQLLKESARMLRPGGHLLLQVPFMWRIHEAPHDFFRYTRFGLEKMCRTAGFDQVRVEETTGFWVMWVVKLNYQLKRLVRGPRPLRALAATLLYPLFWADQHVARGLDRLWPDDRTESAGYFVVARKPSP